MLIDFHLDFETRSRADLKKVGSVKYATDPSTETMLLTWAFGRTGSVKAWRKGTPLPQEIVHVLKYPHMYRFIAWNIQFDYLIWTQVFSKLLGDCPRPPLENLDDAMAISSHFRTGASLEACAQFLNFPLSKDKVGRALMLKCCKPNARTGHFYELTAVEWDHFERYGMIDTRLLRDAYYSLPPLPAPERYAWEWTFRRNLRGIRLDTALVDELASIRDEVMPGLEAEFAQITGGLSVRSPKCLEWFRPHYPWIKNMRAETIRDMLADTRRVHPLVRRALEIKDLAGSSSLSKLDAVKDREHNGFIYEILAYCHAQTKRWAGRGPQIQNYPRVDGTLADNYFDENKPNYKPLDLDIEDLAGVVRKLRPYLKDPAGFVKNLLRRMWLPNYGDTFYCGDFSKVEPSVLLWLLDMGPIPKLWYEEMAAEIYSLPISAIGKDSMERTLGKMANLSCQYGTGWKGFKKAVYKDTAILLTDEMAKQIVTSYRRKNDKIVRFWGDLETAFRKALYGQTSALCGGRVHVMPMQAILPQFKGVAIRLPSGGYLYYHEAREKFEVSYVCEDEEGDKAIITEEDFAMLSPLAQSNYKRQERNVLKYLSDLGNGRVGYKYVYGGLLCENVVSATAREILVPATWRLEQAGFDVLGLVHDEVWGSSYAGRDKEFNTLMCINPSWCDMQISSDLKTGVRYLK